MTSFPVRCASCAITLTDPIRSRQPAAPRACAGAPAPALRSGSAGPYPLADPRLLPGPASCRTDAAGWPPPPGPPRYAPGRSRSRRPSRHAPPVQLDDAGGQVLQEDPIVGDKEERFRAGGGTFRARGWHSISRWLVGSSSRRMSGFADRASGQERPSLDPGRQSLEIRVKRKRHAREHGLGHETAFPVIDAALRFFSRHAAQDHLQERAVQIPGHRLRQA